VIPEKASEPPQFVPNTSDDAGTSSRRARSASGRISRNAATPASTVFRIDSPSRRISSNSFSPGRSPVKTTGISSSVWFETRMRSRARSAIFTGSPMSSMKISRELPSVAACSTSDTASEVRRK